MPVSYTIGVIQGALPVHPGWLEELRLEVKEQLSNLGLQSLDVTLEARDEQHSVVVYIPSTNPAVDSVEVMQAITGGQLVLPIVSSRSNISSELSEPATRLNACFWDEGVRSIAATLLSELGITERVRRVFISHKREDGLLMAEQLHDALSHRAFRPFIDRFAIPPGVDVQSFIADALEEFSFLLLLESPKAASSPWVFDEVEYALTHTMGVMVVSWPNAPSVPGGPDLPRLRLRTKDLRKVAGYDVLRDSKLSAVLDEVEERHRVSLTRRRKMLLQDVYDAMKDAAYHPVLWPDWRILGQSKRTQLVGVAPRLPTVDDLHSLSNAAAGLAPSTDAVLVHAARRLPAGRQALLSWAIAGRPIEMLPGNSVGAYW